LISWMFSQFAVLRNDMHSLLHWGDQIDWMPVAWLGVAGVLLLLGRMLVVWFYWRRVLTKMSADSDMEAQIQFGEVKSLDGGQVVFRRLLSHRAMKPSAAGGRNNLRLCPPLYRGTEETAG